MCVSVLAPACVCGSIHQTFKSVPGFSLDVVKDTLNTSVWTAISGFWRQTGYRSRENSALGRLKERVAHSKKVARSAEKSLRSPEASSTPAATACSHEHAPSTSAAHTRGRGLHHRRRGAARMARTRHALGHAQRGHTHLHAIAGGEGRQLFEGEAHEGQRAPSGGARRTPADYLGAAQQVLSLGRAESAGLSAAHAVSKSARTPRTAAMPSASEVLRRIATTTPLPGRREPDPRG